MDNMSKSFEEERREKKEDFGEMERVVQEKEKENRHSLVEISNYKRKKMEEKEEKERNFKETTKKILLYKNKSDEEKKKTQVMRERKCDL